MRSRRSTTTRSTSCSASRCSSTSGSRSRLLRELRRVVAPGGVCLVNVPTLARASASSSSPPSGSASARPRRWTTTSATTTRATSGRSSFEAGLPAARHSVLQAQVRPQHLRACRVVSETLELRDELRRHVPRRDRRDLEQLDRDALERIASGLAEVRDGGGRLFVLGVGGSAAHACHAVERLPQALRASRRTRRRTTSRS